MKSLHKFLAWVLALLTLLSAFASCKPAPDSLVEDTSLGETETEGETAPPRDPITYYFEDYVVEQPDTPPEVQEKPDTLYEFTQDFSEPIKDNDPNWFINEMADTSKGYLTAFNSQHPYFALKQKAKADLVTLEVDMKANRPNAIPNDSAYIALRLPRSLPHLIRLPRKKKSLSTPITVTKDSKDTTILSSLSLLISNPRKKGDAFKSVSSLL